MTTPANRNDFSPPEEGGVALEAGDAAGTYGRIAPFYDLLGKFYTWGGIKRSKFIHLSRLKPGHSVLYAGAGTGEECVQAALRGVKVTVIDSSVQMLRICQNRFESAGVFGEFVHADATVFDSPGGYDFVVAPFFLNVFDEKGVERALLGLSRLVRRGGQLIVVDFRAPSRKVCLRLVQKMYYFCPLLLFYLLTDNAWHGLYDYRRIVKRLALPLRESGRKATCVGGLPLLETLIWRHM